MLVIYGEIVVFIVLKLVGLGMCVNIDEFIVMIFKVIEIVGGVKRGKVIIILNFVEFLLIMWDIVYCFCVSGDLKVVVEVVKIKVMEV